MTEDNLLLNSFLALLQNRRSIRKFQNKPLTDEMRQIILNAINRAPSAGNLQGYEVYVVTDPKKKANLVKAALNQEFLARVPLVLVFCANSVRSGTRYGRRGESLYSIQDATIAAAYAQLAITALGLATVWVGAFDEAAVVDTLNLPKAFRPVAMLPIGFADEQPPPTSRRSLDDLIHYV